MNEHVGKKSVPLSFRITCLPILIFGTRNYCWSNLKSKKQYSNSKPTRVGGPWVATQTKGYRLLWHSQFPNMLYNLLFVLMSNQRHPIAYKLWHNPERIGRYKGLLRRPPSRICPSHVQSGISKCGLRSASWISKPCQVKWSWWTNSHDLVDHRDKEKMSKGKRNKEGQGSYDLAT